MQRPLASVSFHRIVPALLVLAFASPGAQATLYCNRPYDELTPTSGPPFDSVGFLNNGCTAVLIDKDHIAAAAHCFTDPITGAWQTGLRFYPRFHPDLVVADRNHVPHGDVARAVVGSRAAGGGMSDGMDWGIAKIGSWVSVARGGLTPATLASFIPRPGAPLVNAAYTRHHFPFDDNAPPAWDDMSWDKTLCGGVGESAPGMNDGGMWAIRAHPSPRYDGVHDDAVWCNARWIAGSIHGRCSLKEDAGALLIHNCDSIGGSSGSPLFAKDSAGRWVVIGVGHGGWSLATASANDFGLKVPVCAQDTPQNSNNEDASVERFLDAPRFASSVAVGRSPYSSSMTAVFAVDGDRNRVVWRMRQGDHPSYKGTFSYWLDIGTPAPGVSLTKVASCSVDPGGHPQVFVIAAGTIYTLSPQPSGKWGAWTSIGAPMAGLHFLDLDAVSTSNGKCQVYAVGETGTVFTRTTVPGGATGSWSLVGNGAFRTVSALDVGGSRWLAMVDAAGDLWRIGSSGSGWTAPAKLARPPEVAGWVDADMTWDEAARGFLVAVAKGGGNRLWFLPMYGDKAWAEWHFFDTHLWAPNAKSPTDAPQLETVTASRWMEDAAGVTSPLIFATDVSGDVYFIEYTRVGSPRWVLDWKSFYHEFIPY